MHPQLPRIPERSTPHTEEGGLRTQGHTDNATDLGSLIRRSALHHHKAVGPTTTEQGKNTEVKAGAAQGVASKEAPLADSAADVRQEFQKHS